MSIVKKRPKNNDTVATQWKFVDAQESQPQESTAVSSQDTSDPQIQEDKKQETARIREEKKQESVRIREEKKQGKLRAKEEKKQTKLQVAEEKKQTTMGKIAYPATLLQPIGRLAYGTFVLLSLDNENQCLHIKSMKPNDATDITLPYDRIISLKIDNETNLAKSGGTIGRAIVGGALFGGAGAVVGGMSGKGNTKTKWIAVLSYNDKEGNQQELCFLEQLRLGNRATGNYDARRKSYQATMLEQFLNEIAVGYAEDITEL